MMSERKSYGKPVLDAGSASFTIDLDGLRIELPHTNDYTLPASAVAALLDFLHEHKQELCRPFEPAACPTCGDQAAETKYNQIISKSETFYTWQCAAHRHTFYTRPDGQVPA